MNCPEPWKLAIVGFLMSVGLVGLAHAAWPSSSTINLPVCTAPNMQSGQVLTSDGAGGVIVAWGDARLGSTNFDVYAQHILAAGTVDPGWPANGRAVCTALGNQFNAAIVSDGAGGAIVVWVDSRGGATSDIYAHHILADGTLDAAVPLNGGAICVASGNQHTIAMASAGSGGAILTWRDFRSDTTSDLYAQRILANGQVATGWPLNGVAVCLQPRNQNHPAIAGDGHGGAFVVWDDQRGGTTADIFAQHVGTTGVVDLLWPVDGRAVCAAVGDQTWPDLVRDLAGGFIVCWQDLRGGVNTDVYAQRLLSDGTLAAAWPIDGRVLCGAAFNQQFPRVASDGSGGAIAAWTDSRSGGFSDIYAGHVLADGVVDPAWPMDGRAVCTAFGRQYNQVVAADGLGGLLVAWQDDRITNNFDIYAHHVLASGVIDPAWPVDGRALSTATRLQQAPALLPDGSGGAIVAWFDTRVEVTTSDIYAQRVQANGQLGGTVLDAPAPSLEGVALQRVWPNPSFGGVVQVSYVLPGSGAALLEMVDVAGRTIARRDLADPRAGVTQTIELDCRACPPGVYLVRLRQQGRTFVRRVARLD